MRLEILDILVQNAQPILRAQNLKIGIGDGADGGEGDDLLGVTAGDRVLLDRDQGRLVLAPEIQHIAGAQGIRVEMAGAAAIAATAAGRGRRLADRSAAVEIDGREQRRAGDAHLRVGLLDLRDRDRDVEIVGLGLLDHADQLARSETAPPVELRHRSVSGAMSEAVLAGRVEGEVRLLGFQVAARKGVDNTKNAGNSRRPAQPDDDGAMPCRIRPTPTHLTNSPVFRTFRNYATNARNPAPPRLCGQFCPQAMGISADAPPHLGTGASGEWRMGIGRDTQRRDRLSAPALWRRARRDIPAKRSRDCGRASAGIPSCRCRSNAGRRTPDARRSCRRS